MKKILLSGLAALTLTSNILMASSYYSSDFYFSPRRHVKSYLFSIDIMGQKIKNSNIGAEIGLSSRNINYVGFSNFNWGIMENLEFSKINEKNNIKLDRVNLDIGPTIGYNIMRKTNLYATVGYSGYYMRDSKNNNDLGLNPFYGAGISYFFNDSIVFSLSYKIKNINKNNHWKLQRNQNQINLGMRITFRD